MLSQNIFSTEIKKSEIETETISIKEANENIVNAALALEKDADIVINFKNGTNEIELLRNFLHSSVCLSAFKNELSDPKYKPLMALVRVKVVTASVKMESMAKTPEIIEALQKIQVTPSTPKESMCRFKINDKLLAEDREKDNKLYMNRYNEIMAAKSKAHPVYKDLVEKLEKQKDAIKLGISSDGIEFRPNNYEYNFVKFYDLQLSMALLSLNENMENQKKYFKKDHEEIYSIYCKGKELFDVIPDLELKRYICADENLNKVTNKCLSKVCYVEEDVKKININKDRRFPFTSNDVSLAGSIKHPVLVLEEETNLECSKNSSFSFREKKSLLLFYNKEKNPFGNNDFKKCPIKISFLKSGTKLKILEVLFGNSRGFYDFNRLDLVRFVVADEVNNKYEVSHEDFVNLTNTNNQTRFENDYRFSALKVVLDSLSQGESWDSIAKKKFLLMNPDSFVNTVSEIHGAKIHFKILDQKPQASRREIVFKDAENLKLGLFYLHLDKFL